MSDYAPKGKSRDTEALRLRITGWDLDSIAGHLGWDKPSQAASAIKRAVSNMARFAGDEQRLMELQKLDRLELELWRILERKHYIVTPRGLVTGEDGLPLEDDRVGLETVDRLIKVAERRSRLMGLDAPLRAQILTIDSVDAEIARLEAELATVTHPRLAAGTAKALEQAKARKNGQAVVDGEVIESAEENEGV